MSVISKASFVQIPSGYGEDKLYSEVPNTTAGDFTFTRASTGTRVNADGYIEEVPWNLITYSEDYSSQWSKSNTTIIANDTISPRGTQDASKIYPNSSGNYRHIRNPFFNPSSGLYTFSIYAKAAELDHLVLIDYDGSGIGIDFDLTNGVATDNASTPFDSFSMTDVGNGWYRCVATATDMYFYWILSDNGGLSVTANGTDGLFIWGAMINKGTSVKRYIKTTDRLDIPRLDYSGGASCPTLLLEPQRTNLVPYSEDFSQWSAIGSNQTLVNNTNPIDNNAYGIESSVTSSHSRIYRNALMTAGNDYSSTYLVKPSSNPPEYLGFACISNLQPDVLYDFANDQFVDFNIVGNAAKCESISMNNGWKLLKVPVHENVINTRFNIYQGSRVGNNLYGTTGQSYYIKFAQLEQGSYSTSYIPSTSGTSVTRVGDVCKDAGDATIFNDSEGVLFVEIKALSDLVESRLSINNGTNLQTIQIRQSGSVSNQYNIGFSNGTLNKFIVVDDITQYNKIAVSYNSSEAKIFINGIEVASDNLITTPIGLDRLSFDRGDNSFFFYGKVKQLIYFDQALTDEELATLTTI